MSQLDAYLTLEREMLTLDNRADPGADALRDALDPMWRSLTDEDRARLNQRAISSAPYLTSATGLEAWLAAQGFRDEFPGALRGIWCRGPLSVDLRFGGEEDKLHRAQRCFGCRKRVQACYGTCHLRPGHEGPCACARHS